MSPKVHIYVDINPHGVDDGTPLNVTVFDDILVVYEAVGA